MAALAKLRWFHFSSSPLLQGYEPLRVMEQLSSFSDIGSELAEASSKEPLTFKRAIGK